MDMKKELENKIVKYSQAYYLGEPIASDVQFDNLCSQLEILDPTNPILNQVGYGLKVYGQKIKLPFEIQASLPKIKDISSYECSELDNPTDVIAPKLDGLSILVDIKENYFSAMTRGDGEYGVDVTEKAKLVPSLMEAIQKMRGLGNLCMRGEFIVRPSVFNKFYASEYANPRNLVSGIVNRKGFEGLEHVEFIPFDIKFENKFLTIGHKAKTVFLFAKVYSVFSECFLKTSKAYSNKDLEEIYTIMKSEDLPLDGLVINGEVAWKAENTSVQGEVDHIEWQLSRLGKLIPVVVLKTPVDLYGTQVQRASAFNYQFICENTLGPNSVIKITKANEIIPYITEVVKGSHGFSYLETCPICGGKTHREGVHIACKFCYNPMQSALEGFMETFLLPKGVQQAEGILDALFIRTPKDLKKLWLNHTYCNGLLELAIGPHKTDLFLNHVLTLDKIDTKKFLSSLSLPGLGETASEEVSYHLSEYISKGIEGIKGKVKINAPATKALTDHYKLVVQFYNEFVNFMKVPEKKDFSAKVCVTGKLSESRSVFSKKLENAGVKLTESLDKNTILVTNEATSGSSKNKRAKELGIEVISEEEARSRWLKSN